MNALFAIAALMFVASVIFIGFEINDLSGPSVIDPPLADDDEPK